MRGCGSLATNILGKAENVHSLTVSLLRLTCKVQGVARCVGLTSGTHSG